MTTDWPDRRFSPLAWLILVAAWALPDARADWPPTSFDAHYEVLVNGKRRLETQVRFERDGTAWRMHSHSEGVKGLARFIGAETIERASGEWAGKRLLTKSFEHRAEFATRQRHWSADFDRERGVIRTRHDDDANELGLADGTIDPLALTLQLSAHLEGGERHWSLPVLDRDEIDEHRYTAHEPAPVQTPLGCFVAVEVERVREHSDRYSSVWLAPELDWVSVRVVHGRREGREFVMQIDGLTLGGEAVERRPDCE